MNVPSNRTLGLVVIAAVLYWLCVAVAMHVLVPELDPIRVPMSAYVLSGHGGWVTPTYFAMAAALLGTSVGLRRTLPHSSLMKAAFALALVAASAACLAGVFPMDFPPPVRTVSGRLHLLGGLVGFPAKALSAVLFALSFRRDRSWRRVSVPALVLAAGMAAAFVLAVASFRILGFAGWTQRIFIPLHLGWLTVVSVHLIRLKPCIR